MSSNRGARCRAGVSGAALIVGLLAGCSGPRAWNDYLNPAYTGIDREAVTSGNALAIEVKSSVPGVQPADLQALVAKTMTGNPSATAPTNASSRAVWQFSGTAEAVHARADYYRDASLISTAEGSTAVANATDPRLSALVADVTSELFPPLMRRGGGGGR